MPIYEYHCNKCGDFEVIRKMSDKPLTQCPTCRRKVTKLISTTSFQLKGSGWYVTDYARKDGAKSAGTSEEKKPAEKVGGDTGAGEKSSSGDKTSSSDKTSSGDKASSSDKTSSGGKASGGDKKSSEKSAAA